MQRTGRRPKLVVTGDGVGVVGRAGTRLLADLAERSGLAGGFSDVLAGLRRRDTGHGPGQVATDLAVLLADGGQAISDLAVLRAQPALFGPVASTSTAWRVLAGIGDGRLAALDAARAAARQRVWASAAAAGRPVPAARAAGRDVPGLVIDLDATIVICHSGKAHAAATFKGSFGYHPLLGFCDNTGEALAGILRPGDAGSNTAADHITVLDACLTQFPAEYRYGQPILVRTDAAGCTKAFLHHIRSLREQVEGRPGIDIRFSVGMPVTEPIRRVLAHLADVDQVWQPALDQDGEFRSHAQICEITDLVDTGNLPPGTRVIVRRELPHPGAQLSLFDHIAGWRHTLIATDTPPGTGNGGGPIQYLETRHRGHARVEDRIRCGKTTGIGRFPSREFPINAAWLALALTGIDLLAWTRWLLLDGDLATAEPKKLRYRLLHVAARLTRTGRQTYLRIDHRWPWRQPLITAYNRLHQLPQPAT